MLLATDMRMKKLGKITQDEEGGLRMTKMIKVIYGNQKFDLDRKQGTSMILSSMEDFFPELKKGYTTEYKNFGTELHIKTMKEKRVNPSMSYFSYIEVDGRQFFIKDMHSPIVVKTILMARQGDCFSIKGLGNLKLDFIHYRPYEDNGYTIKEIGFMCSTM